MPEQRSTYPIKRWYLRDILVLALIIIFTFFAAWILKSEKTKYVVVVVEENVNKEIESYKIGSKDRLEEWLVKKLKI